MKNLTDYQKAQLLYLHFEGDFRYTNSKGNKVGRSAWAKMIDALLEADFINGECQITPAGQAYLDKNHWTINLDVLN